MKRRGLFITILAIVGLTHCAAKAQWVKTQFPTNNFGNSNYFINGNFVFISLDGFGKFFRSSDNGLRWEDIYSRLPKEKKVLALTQCGSYLVSCIFDWNVDSIGGVYRSIDTGASWQRITGNGSQVQNVVYFENINNNLFGATASGEIILSSDSGNSWRNYTNGLNSGFVVTKLLLNGKYLYASTIFGGGVCRSSDFGMSWKSFNNEINAARVTSMTSQGDTLFATADGDIYISTDSAEHWNNKPSDPKATLILTTKNLLFAAAERIYCSSDNGNTWKDIDDNRFKQVSFIFANDEYLFGAVDSEIWRRPISDFYSSVSKNESAEKSNLTISFSPSTNQLTIKYYCLQPPLPAKFEIYDLLGRLILSKSIANASQGWNSFDCDAHEIKNGSYVCRMSSSESALTKLFQITK